MESRSPFFQNFYLFEILLIISCPPLHSSFVDELFSPSNHAAINQSYVVGSTVHSDSNAMNLTEQRSFSARIYVPPNGARMLSTPTRPMSDQDYEKWLERGEKGKVTFKDFDDDDDESRYSDLIKTTKSGKDEKPSVERDVSKTRAPNTSASSEEPDFFRPRPTRIRISDFTKSKSAEFSNKIIYEAAANRSIAEGVRNANGLFVFVTKQPLPTFDHDNGGRSGSDQQSLPSGRHKADGVRNTNGLFPLPPNLRIRIHSKESSAEALPNDELKHEKQQYEGKVIKVTDELQAFSATAVPVTEDSGTTEARPKAEGVRNQNGLYTLSKEAAAKAAVSHANEANRGPSSAEIGVRKSNGLYTLPTSHNSPKSQRNDGGESLPTPKGNHLDGVALNPKLPENPADPRVVRGLYNPSSNGGGKINKPRHRSYEEDVDDEPVPPLPPVPRLEDVRNRHELKEHPGYKRFGSQSNERVSTYNRRHRPHGAVEGALIANSGSSLTGDRNSHGFHAHPKQRVLGRVGGGGGEGGLHAAPNIPASKSRSTESTSRNNNNERDVHGFFAAKPVKVNAGKKARENQKSSSTESGVAQTTNSLAHGSEALEPFSPNTMPRKLPALLEAVKTVMPFANAGSSAERSHNDKVVAEHGTTTKIEKTDETKVENETTNVDAFKTAKLKLNVTGHSSNEKGSNYSKASNSLEDDGLESHNNTEKHDDGSYDDDSAGDCGEWSRWSKCSKPCGGCGTRRRKRVCKDSKEPQIEKLSCHLRTCPFPRQTCCKGREPQLVDKMLICLKKEKKS